MKVFDIAYSLMNVEPESTTHNLNVAFRLGGIGAAYNLGAFNFGTAMFEYEFNTMYGYARTVFEGAKIPQYEPVQPVQVFIPQIELRNNNPFSNYYYPSRGKWPGQYDFSTLAQADAWRQNTTGFIEPFRLPSDWQQYRIEYKPYIPDFIKLPQADFSLQPVQRLILSDSYIYSLSPAMNDNMRIMQQYRVPITEFSRQSFLDELRNRPQLQLPGLIEIPRLTLPSYFDDFKNYSQPEVPQFNNSITPQVYEQLFPNQQPNVLPEHYNPALTPQMNDQMRFMQEYNVPILNVPQVPVYQPPIDTYRYEPPPVYTPPQTDYNRRY
jgi:hypothetical protein